MKGLILFISGFTFGFVIIGLYICRILKNDKKHTYNHKGVSWEEYDLNERKENK